MVEQRAARLARSEQPPRRARRVLQGLLRLPTFYKVLVANGAVVVLGALAGTAITASRVQHNPGADVFALMAAFVAAGIAVSLAVNAIVLRAALAPLHRIERTIQAVRAGQADCRVPTGQLTDAEIERVAETLNAMLDELERARARQASLASQVITAQEEERRRIARELHDDTAQSLTSLLLYAKALEQNEERPAMRTALAEVREEVGRSLETIRRLARELRPSALDDLGLVAALDAHAQEFGRRTGIEVRFVHDGAQPRLDPPIELALFRVAQEALTNAAKHAGVRVATLRFVASDRLAVLVISDDGRGFDTASAAAGVGLYSMRERMLLVGGLLTINAGERGVEVRAEAPLDTPNAVGAVRAAR
jgi:two-component system, NarL family, sensor histidine kinase UhpB